MRVSRSRRMHDRPLTQAKAFVLYHNYRIDNLNKCTCIVRTSIVSTASLQTCTYDLRTSKWKAGVSNFRFRFHFLPPLTSNPSPTINSIRHSSQVTAHNKQASPFQMPFSELADVPTHPFRVDKLSGAQVAPFAECLRGDGPGLPNWTVSNFSAVCIWLLTPPS